MFLHTFSKTLICDGDNLHGDNGVNGDGDNVNNLSYSWCVGGGWKLDKPAKLVLNPRGLAATFVGVDIPTVTAALYPGFGTSLC